MIQSRLAPSKTLKCKQCKAKLAPEAKGKFCGYGCINAFSDAFAAAQVKRREVKARKEQRIERRETKVRLEKFKTPSKHEQECRAIVQKIARIRDRDDGCISCHMPANYSGAWHGSHYRPAGNNAAVQFNLWNIHKSCAQCNLFKGGNLSAYRPRLIAKIGLERVEWLESQNQPMKTSVPYLIRFKAVMGKRLRRIEKQSLINTGQS